MNNNLNIKQTLAITTTNNPVHEQTTTLLMTMLAHNEHKLL